MNGALRYAMIGSLLYSSYLVAKCPCDKPVECQKTSFLVATLVPVAVVLFF
jgi:hypothetical protein